MSLFERKQEDERSAGMTKKDTISKLLALYFLVLIPAIIFFLFIFAFNPTGWFFVIFFVAFILWVLFHIWLFCWSD